MLQDMIDSGVEGQVSIGISVEHLNRWVAFASNHAAADFGPKALLQVLQVRYAPMMHQISIHYEHW
jgi:hypothetical protein